MIKVGFLVEGDSDRKLLESQSFKDFFRECQIDVINIIATKGCYNMSSNKVEVFVNKLKKLKKSPDKIILLADMNSAPCYTKRIKNFKHADIDLIIIAKQSIESWLLADTKAMQKKTGNQQFKENTPENIAEGAWPKLQNIWSHKHKKPTKKLLFL